MDIKCISLNKIQVINARYETKLFKISSNCNNDEKIKCWLFAIVNKNKSLIAENESQMKEKDISKIYFIIIKDDFQDLDFPIGMCIKKNKEGNYCLNAKIQTKNHKKITEKIAIINHIKDHIFEKTLKEL